jgi:nucleoporin GLE1
MVNHANEEQMRIFALRNSEATHAAALAAAQAEHTRIRENALRVFELEQLRVQTEIIRQQRIQDNERERLEIEELRESNERLRQERIRMEERARLESERAAEALRIQQSTSAVATPPSTNQLAAAPQSTPAPAPPQATPQAAQPQPKTTIALKTGNPPTSQSPAPANPTSAPASQLQQSQLPASQSLQTKTNAAAPAPNQSKQVQPTSAAPTTQPQATPSTQVKLNYAPFDHLHPAADRFIEIHKALKQHRKHIKEFGDKNAAFKKKAGDMRRAITRSMGQLVEGSGQNKVPVSAPLAVNRAATLTTVTVPNDPHSTQRIPQGRPEPANQPCNVHGYHTRAHCGCTKQ